MVGITWETGGRADTDTLTSFPREARAGPGGGQSRVPCGLGWSDWSWREAPPSRDWEGKSIFSGFLRAFFFSKSLVDFNKQRRLQEHEIISRTTTIGCNWVRAISHTS